MADDPIPRGLSEKSYACNAPGLTAQGGPLFHYAQAEGNLADCSGLVGQLRPHHECYPLWVCPNLNLYLEHWEHPAPPGAGSMASPSSSPMPPSPSCREASEDLLSVAEPRSRPDLVHSYALTTESLHGAAYGHDMAAADILAVLAKYSKTLPLPHSVVRFVEDCSARHCRAKLLLLASKHYVVSDGSVLDALLKNPAIAAARMPDAFSAAGEFEGVETLAAEDDRQHFKAGGAGAAAGRAGGGGGGGGKGESDGKKLRLAPPSSPVYRLERRDACAEEGVGWFSAMAAAEAGSEAGAVGPGAAGPGVTSALEGAAGAFQGGGLGDVGGGNNGGGGENGGGWGGGGGPALGVWVAMVTDRFGVARRVGSFPGAEGDEKAARLALAAYEAAAAERDRVGVDQPPGLGGDDSAAVAAAAPTAASSAAAAPGAVGSTFEGSRKRFLVTLPTGSSGGSSGGGSSEGGGKKLRLVLPVRGAGRPGVSVPGTAGLPSGRRSKLSHRFRLRSGKGEVEAVRREAWASGFPLLEEYDFARDSKNNVSVVACEERKNTTCSSACSSSGGPCSYTYCSCRLHELTGCVALYTSPACFLFLGGGWWSGAWHR